MSHRKGPSFEASFEIRRLTSAAGTAMRRGDTPGAIEYLKAALRHYPQNLAVLVPLGLQLYKCSRLGEAENVLNAALKLQPSEPTALYGLGAVRAATGDFEAGIELLRKAIAIAPDNVFAFEELARALAQTHRSDEAEDVLREALSRHPEDPNLLNALASRQQTKGQFEEAMQTYKRSARLRPVQSQAYAGIASGRRLAEQDRPFVDSMRSVLDQAPLPPDERIQLLFALGKAHDDLGEYERAMACWREANALSEQDIAQAGQFVPDEITRLFEGLPKIFSRDVIEAPRERAAASVRPIFIVGMMRSGTTLIEQILSRHSEVAAGGELGFWPERYRALIDLDQSRFHEQKALQAARQYLDLLREIGSGAPNVTDKLPENYRLLGLLRALYPSAVFIHSRRHPVDTCLSIFAAGFHTPPPYSRSPDKLVFMYRHYLELMNYWRSVLPASALLEIQYESVVENPADQTRRLLQFLGLPWEDACLSPERSDRPVLTSSLWQVRQPVYNSSAGRWRNYEPWLGAFEELLDDSERDSRR